ncbi:hypothetical protein LEP1GSC124_2045 [Leptospira interrogans serovar Pyrogenes str. 200701872]|uniref:Uncharacterized protein n=1 Tax=Leptospira interrogans serovar Pyrogenes str. 200701872 TaxID=1193029 RepID=M6ZPI8_LEPIR|nr:hypothetical protein LEP1GSC124_2045 [Leptospira interrogans serovar Pyrogenes str. 200701872]
MKYKLFEYSTNDILFRIKQKSRHEVFENGFVKNLDLRLKNLTKSVA